MIFTTDTEHLPSLAWNIYNLDSYVQSRTEKKKSTDRCLLITGNFHFHLEKLPTSNLLSAAVFLKNLLWERKKTTKHLSVNLSYLPTSSFSHFCRISNACPYLIHHKSVHSNWSFPPQVWWNLSLSINILKSQTVTLQQQQLIRPLPGMLLTDEKH